MRQIFRGMLASVLAGTLLILPTNSFAVSFDSVTHIHGVKVFGKEILMPTHEGLYKYTAANSMKLADGPIFDVMGLAAYEKTLYASGHPGLQFKLLNPVGLISSQDGGKNWKKVSLEGSVDFHMLEVGKFDIYGADAGTNDLMHSSNQGKSWKKLGKNRYTDIAPTNTKGSAYALLAGQIVQTKNSFSTTVVMKSNMKWNSIEVVGTSVYGASGKDIYRSTDGAKSWKKIATLPQNVFGISFNNQIFAATAGSSIYVSRDGGKSFKS